MSIIV